MSKGFTKKYKSSKLKPFFFFLFLATVFWVLTRFSRDFTTTMEAKVIYENIPETVALSENNVDHINFDLTANGFEILFYKLKKPSVEILVSKYYNQGQNSFILPKNELIREVSASFNRNLEVKNLSVENLEVNLTPIILKKVRVKPQMEISFKNGFNALDTIVVIPDSITISGPSELLNEIKFVETELLSLNKVDKSVEQNVKIKNPGQQIISLKPNEVSVQIPVAEFSQVQYVLPVEVINLPPNLEIKLVPKTISITFDIGVEEFSAISKDNFRIVCDFSKRNKEENFLIPELDKKPKAAININFDPKKIDYLIFE